MSNLKGEPNEVFRLEDGTEVSVGLNLPDEQEMQLMATVAEYPSELFLENADIERALKQNATDRYKEERKKRRKRMRHQARLGKCNGSSNASAIEQLQEVQGMPDEAISDCWLYMNMNGGSDRGSALIRSYELVQKSGASPMVVQVAGMNKTLPNDAYNRNQVARDVLKAADAAAANNKGLEFYRAPKDYNSFVRAIASAIARRHPIVWAWHVGGNSMKLRNGYLVAGRGSGNHSNLLHSGKWVGGSDLVHPDNQNSWGPCVDPLYGMKTNSGWGEGGFGLVTMETAFACNKYHYTYICPSLRVDGTDPAAQ